MKNKIILLAIILAGLYAVSYIETQTMMATMDSETVVSYVESTDTVKTFKEQVKDYAISSAVRCIAPYNENVVCESLQREFSRFSWEEKTYWYVSYSAENLIAEFITDDQGKMMASHIGHVSWREMEKLRTS